jgi:hypothetical protein
LTQSGLSYLMDLEENMLDTNQLMPLLVGILAVVGTIGVSLISRESRGARLLAESNLRIESNPLSGGEHRNAFLIDFVKSSKVS